MIGNENVNELGCSFDGEQPSFVLGAWGTVETGNCLYGYGTLSMNWRLLDWNCMSRLSRWFVSFFALV